MGRLTHISAMEGGHQDVVILLRERVLFSLVRPGWAQYVTIFYTLNSRLLPKRRSAVYLLQMMNR